MDGGGEGRGLDVGVEGGLGERGPNSRSRSPEEGRRSPDEGSRRSPVPSSLESLPFGDRVREI